MYKSDRIKLYLNAFRSQAVHLALLHGKSTIATEGHLQSYRKLLQAAVCSRCVEMHQVLESLESLSLLMCSQPSFATT